MAHFTIDERCELYTLMKSGYTMTEAATKLNKSPSTISRELARNGGPQGYRPGQAQVKAEKRKREKPKRSSLTEDTIAAIIEGLSMGLSPEQISKSNREKREDFASPTTIYRFIHNDRLDGGKLYKFLTGNYKTRKYLQKNKKNIAFPKTKTCDSH